MKLLSFLSVIASIGMIILMYVLFSPVLDSPVSSTSDRVLLGSALLLQLYLLFFSLYAAYKFGGLVKWETTD
jgi:hypothetical protein